MSYQYITHKTKAGERWDLLAFDYYGDATRFMPIIRANASLGLGKDPIIPEGTVLRIPLLEDDTSTSSASTVPWRVS